MDSSEERVCPDCGQPAGAQPFCAACGLNLASLDRLPSRAEWEAAASQDSAASDAAGLPRDETVGTADPPPVKPAGWFPDPWDSAQQRYWDGSAWTGYQHPAALPVSAPNQFCRTCGTELAPHAAVCLSCGAAALGTAAGVANPKSPGLALFLSFLWPGAGQLYAGDSSGKTITFLILASVLFVFYLTIIGLIFLPLGLILAIIAMIDARDVAMKWNVDHGFPAGG